MRYQFDPSRVRRIAIGCEYIIESTDGPFVVIETPGGRWSVRRRALSRTVRVQPPTATSGSRQTVSGNIGGPVTQMSGVRGNLRIGDGIVQVDDDAVTSKVTVRLPAGHTPDIISL